MSVNLSIKGVPEELAARLRERAAKNHRSLQGELLAIIESAVRGSASADTPDTRPPGPRRSVLEIAVEHRQRFPEPLTFLPLAVDIIRHDRDSR